MQQQKLNNGFFTLVETSVRDLLSLGWLGYSKSTKIGEKMLGNLLPLHSFVSLEKSTKNSFQHAVPPRVWLGSMIPSAFLHQRYEVLVIIRVDG